MNSIFGNNIKTIEFDALIIGGLIQFLLKAVLHVLLQVLTQMMIGDGICMTQLKVQILLEIRMQ